MRSVGRVAARITSVSKATREVPATGISPTTGAPIVKPVVSSRLRASTIPSLEHFIQRQRALHLYRDILRRLFTIPKTAHQQRDEFIAHARAEFERNKHVDDVAQIRYLISTGKADMKGWERMIQELASR